MCVLVNVCACERMCVRARVRPSVIRLSVHPCMRDSMRLCMHACVHACMRPYVFAPVHNSLLHLGDWVCAMESL